MSYLGSSFERVDSEGSHPNIAPRREREGPQTFVQSGGVRCLPDAHITRAPRHSPDTNDGTFFNQLSPQLALLCQEFGARLGTEVGG